MQLLALKDISFNYRMAATPLFDELQLTINRGDCQLIYGPTGSGKSSLLKLMLGILEQPFSGERCSSEGLTLGVVMQDPNVQLLRQNIGAEVAFALENLGVAADLMRAEVTKALRQVGLYISLDTPVQHLSLGQRYRLMIAAQLVLKPDILLLDEPWAQLDDQGVQELSQLIQKLQSQAMAIVIVEHQKSAFLTCSTHRWQLQAGQLIPYINQQPVNQVLDIRALHSPSQIAEQVLVSPGFAVRFSDNTCLLESEQISLNSGEIVALTGENGTGKSTLLKCLSGIQADVDSCNIKLLGKKPKLGIYGAELALLHQRPSRQLFETRVIDEMQFSLKRYGLPLERAAELLADLELMHLMSLSPHTLSYGQQHLVALASLACLQPKVLLLDDPFAGLDDSSFLLVAKLLLKLSEQGCAIVIASHRPIAHLPIDKVWHISDKRLHTYSPNEFAQHQVAKQALSTRAMGYACVG
ncbi:ATP-binding cassette domain-containing protein [Shewanella sp. Isolate11]|uniref:ATP-binding cassette domain-containing protein n=1 Tax=Shewanella sp. Isolate11 TaxID=2908530 RepID=UPI001EFC66F1|nr:ATP-binding cassette domain-containing protein [Shewanella sp. Isolate11]MCG9697953.1 ATP-binding cassette domain-containing protein [Shewanella sp. Isolate11]